MSILIHDEPLPYVPRLAERPLTAVTLVVIHCTELPDLATARAYGERVLHEDGTGNSGHYYIDRDGTSAAMCRKTASPITRGRQRAHAGHRLLNRGRWPHWWDSRHQTMTEPYPPAQIDALCALLGRLRASLPRLAAIAGHEDPRHRARAGQRRPVAQGAAQARSGAAVFLGPPAGERTRTDRCHAAVIIVRCPEWIASMREAHVRELIDLLQLERLEDNLFRGQSRDIGTPFVFGGRVLGRALSAAQQTVDPGPRGAFAARLFPARRRRTGADRLQRRAHPRRRLVLLTAGGGDPARPAGSWTVRSLFPDRRTRPRTPDRHARRADAGGTLLLAPIPAEKLAALPEKVQRWLGRDLPIEFREVQPMDRLAPEKRPPAQYIWFRLAAPIASTVVTSMPAAPDGVSGHQLRIKYRTRCGY